MKHRLIKFLAFIESIGFMISAFLTEIFISDPKGSVFYFILPYIFIILSFIYKEIYWKEKEKDDNEQ